MLQLQALGSNQIKFMQHSLKPLWYVVLGGLCLSLLSFFIWISVNDVNQNILFGRVTDVSATSITIANKQDEVTVISLTGSTSVSRKRDELSITDIPVNSFVQITSNESDTEPVAQSIRLMKLPDEDLKHDKGR